MVNQWNILVFNSKLCYLLLKTGASSQLSLREACRWPGECQSSLVEFSCFEGLELPYRIGGRETSGDECDLQTCDQLFQLAARGMVTQLVLWTLLNPVVRNSQIFKCPQCAPP